MRIWVLNQFVNKIVNKPIEIRQYTLNKQNLKRRDRL